LKTTKQFQERHFTLRSYLQPDTTPIRTVRYKTQRDSIAPSVLRWNV